MIRPMLAAALLPLPLWTPAPPVPSVPKRVMLAWLPGETRCAGVAVAAAPMRRPWLTMVWSPNPALHPLVYGFRISADGRTLGIHRTDGSEYASGGDDIAPSLAATRFAAGSSRSGCTISYTPRQTALAETPTPDLFAYTMNPQSGPLPDEGWARIRGDGDCERNPRPEVLVQAFPAFRSLPATPGVRDWTMIGYDLDARGRPVRVRQVTGTGNDALATAAVKAMAASRFTAGAHRGCLYPYWRASATLAAPPIPDEVAPRRADATCPERHDWSVTPTLRYPEPYRRRSIEGWAVVTYDVAPWGEVGNVHVAAAEPSDDFGRQAVEVIRSAKVPTTQGLVGCVDRVRFRIPVSRPTSTAMAGTPPPA